MIKKVGDIFEDALVKTRPFDMPSGYVGDLERRVSDEIGMQQGRGGLWTILKPAALLVCSFAFVLLMGYGMMALTGTKSGYNTTANAPSTEEFVIEDDEIVDYLAQSLSLEEISEFISADHSNSTLRQ